MDFYRLVNSGEGRGYFGVNWALTTKCNYRCTYCHPDLYNGKIKTAGFDVVSRFVNQVFSYCEQKGMKPFFEFAGGEVTYVKWFGDLLTLIHQRGGLVTVISNASSSLDWWKQHVHAIHSACLSFHSGEVKDKAHFIQVAEMIQDAPKTNLHVNIMMQPDRFDECLAFARELKARVECGIALQPLYHGFGAGAVTAKHTYTEQQEAIMRDFRGGWREKHTPNPRGAVLLSMNDGKTYKTSNFELLVAEKTNFTGWDCYAGIENIIVTFEGDIYRGWCKQDGPIGSIYADEIVLPQRPTLCKTPICQCGADICSTKLKRDLAPLEIAL
jgi:MoaA/NifB/PqqE/SkfB family radical SAM enzyme